MKNLHNPILIIINSEMTLLKFDEKIRALFKVYKSLVRISFLSFITSSIPFS